MFSHMQAEFSGGVLVCNGMVTLRRVSQFKGAYNYIITWD